MTGGAAVGDYDGDGLDDLFVTRLDNHDLLFRNLGDGTFLDASAEAGLAAFNVPSNAAAWLDIDNDGDLDLFVTTVQWKRYYLFVNNGLGGFTEEALWRGAAVESSECHTGWAIAVGDYDKDGWLDIHLGEWGQVHPETNHSRLLRNRGLSAPGYFEDRTQAAGIFNLSALYPTGLNVYSSVFSSTFVDLDRDGWLDLAIASDFRTGRLFWNNKDGTFSDGTSAANVGTGTADMGSTFGDYDLDGDLDWFVTDISCEQSFCQGNQFLLRQAGNRLFRYDANRVFRDQTDAAAVRRGYWGWGAVFLDFDNDIDLDLVMTNGADFPRIEESLASIWRTDPTILWENDGTGRMTEVAVQRGMVDTRSGKGLLTWDYDNDGDLDIFIVNNGSTPILYRNVGGNENGWLRVKVRAAHRAFEGLNAWVTVTPVEGGEVLVREVGVSSHFLGQSERTLHFGLGAGDAPVHELKVKWFFSGIEDTHHTIPRNSVFELVAPSEEVIDTPNILRVETPNGGEVWGRGTTRDITWVYGGAVGTLVRIELLKGDVLDRVIVESTANVSNYSWTVPGDLTPSANYRVQITSVHDDEFGDASDGGFSIVAGAGSPVHSMSYNGPCEEKFGLLLKVSGDGTISPGVGQTVHIAGAIVFLTATAGPGSHFTGWTGTTASSQNPLTVVLDEDAVLQANFRASVTLTVTYDGEGIVEPAGVTQQTRNSGVVITATPAPGWAFDRWTGDVQSIANPIELLMNSDKTVTAVFVPGPVEGEGAGEDEGDGGNDGEGEGGTGGHTADRNQDGVFSLSELLRVIQFYNSGGFGCEGGTEDGYAPNDPDRDCTRHASDYAPHDWTINLPELLRAIQFLNSGAYYACPGANPPTEDGFCPGAA